MERAERRRKRSRKASETEQATEESPPPVKTRRRSSAGTLTQGGTKGNARTRKKGLTVSFDIAEHSLSIGEGATGAGSGQCTLTLGSAATPPGATENVPRTRRGSGAGAGSGDIGGVVKKPVAIKFKNDNFTFSYLSLNKKRSWKSYKQIVAAERALVWRPSDPTFSSLDTPPPLKPAKKYADLSGLSVSTELMQCLIISSHTIQRVSGLFTMYTYNTYP
jgi:INO80 complex subunit C